MPDGADTAGELGDLRTRAEAARTEAIRLEAAAATARATLEAARRVGAADAGLLAAELERRVEEAAAAREARDAATAVLGERLRDVIVAFQPEADLAALATDIPLVLLPLRLETRFAAADPRQLLVRVFPDQVHIENHEPELTDAEVTLGRDFWEAVWRGGTADDQPERDAWAVIAGRLGSNRAAWVVRQCEPVGGTRPTAPVPAGPGAPLPDPPVFPEPARRAGAWARPAVARTLPDRFVALAVAGGREVARAWGGPIPDELPVGPDPLATPPQPDPDGPPVPEELRWLTEFERAEAAGMALRLALPAGTERLDRLLVFGVSATLDPEAGAARLGALLDSHHYGRGLGFVAPGTPSNNAEATRAGWSSRRPPEASFPVERRPPAAAGLDPAANAAVTAAAFGLPAELLLAVEGAAAREQALAAAMHTTLWAVTWGHWLERLAQPGIPAGAVARLRRHFVDLVRGRGPVPTLRVANQPYGVLPATSFDRLAPLGGEAADEAAFARFLAGLRPYWRAGLEHVPVVRAGHAPDQGLLGALAREPVSRHVRVRSALGENVTRAFSNLFGVGTEGERQAFLSRMVLAALGVEAWPYLAGMVLGDEAARLRLPLVSGKPGAQADAEIGGALRRLLSARFAELTAEARDPATALSLLHLLARQAALLERLLAGLDLESDAIAAQELPRRFDAEVFVLGEDAQSSGLASVSPGLAFSSYAARSSVMARTIPQVTGTATVADWIDREVVGIEPQRLPPLFGRYGEFASAVGTLASTPATELELLLGEALDCCSHRLDAWLTSVASHRLRALRTAKPTGVHLGAYGIVEDLVRRPPRRPVADPPQGAPAGLVEDPANAGFVHAPSLAHATTAAVLRSGHLTHGGGDDGSPFAVDLSSRRVRLALSLLDGVRAGQPLGALLGYRLERELHEGFPGLELDEVIDQLRRLAPLPAVTAPPADPEALPARNVADGLALHRMGAAEVQTVITLTGGQQAERRAAVGQVLASLADAVDALGDLLLSESVFQLVGGNLARAAAHLDALGRGTGAAPEPDVVRTPRSGTGITQRVLVLVPASVGRRPGWATNRPRSQAEPRLDAWAGHLLGDPSRVTIRAVYERTLQDGSTEHTDHRFTLDQLGLCALDVVYESEGAPGARGLDQRLLRHLRRNPPSEQFRGADVALDPSFTTGQGPSLAALEETARAARALLCAARPLTAADLARPQDAVPAGGNVTELRGRASLAVATLRAAATALAGAVAAVPPEDVPPERAGARTAAIAAALDRVADFGLVAVAREGQPVPELGLDEVAQQVAGAAIERADRSEAALAGPSDERGRSELAALAEAFGADFRAVSLVSAAGGAGLRDAFAAQDDLLRDAAGAASAWLLRTAAVRDGAARLAELLSFTDALDHRGPFDLAVAQTPLHAFVAEETEPQPAPRWIGLGFTHPLGPEPVTSFLAHTVAGLDPTGPLCGLMVDEWVEVVPNRSVTTGVAFHADAPGARAPQAILVAVSPDPAQPWDLATLADVVRETVELAKLRLVDLDDVAWLARLLPAIYLPAGDVPEVFTVDLHELVRRFGTSVGATE